MKRMKKLASFLLAAIMVLSMTVSAFAADGYSISIDAVAEGEVVHTYEVYQIFAGTLSTNEDGDTILLDLVWGENGTGTVGEEVEEDVVKALEAASGTDAEKLAVIKLYATLSDPYKIVNSGETLEGVPAGYYLIKDVDGAWQDKDAAYTQYVVKVVKDVTVTPKSAKPSVDKEVYDDDDKVAVGDNAGWGETADHNINESFQFKLTATLTADTDFDAYETYKVIFNDTMSDGVTFESIDSVTVDGVPLDADDYTCDAKAGQAGGFWALTIEDIKAFDDVNLSDGAAIVVIYNAHLNEDATVNHTSGTTDNKNTVYLQYSNNPNASGSGDSGNDDTGKTEEDHVWVFTYDVNNTKYKNEVNKDNILAGAGFTLYDADGNVVKLYLSNGAYYVYDEENAPEGVEVVEKMTSQEDGTFNIKGLDVGTYTLKETTIPTGYNKCDDVEIVISATHSEATDGASATTTLTEATKNTDNDIVNKAGTTLPETGGIGTTIFYVLGAVLVIGAVVVMVTKKRMSVNK